VTLAQYLLAAASGGLLVYWGLFLFVAGGMAGEIYWNGVNHGHFLPGYLASLYMPPLLATAVSYLAFRLGKTVE
jgi:hypothetical protein